jgi:hypothetical protein
VLFRVLLGPRSTFSILPGPLDVDELESFVAERDLSQFLPRRWTRRITPTVPVTNGPKTTRCRRGGSVSVWSPRPVGKNIQHTLIYMHVTFSCHLHCSRTVALVGASSCELAGEGAIGRRTSYRDKAGGGLATKTVARPTLLFHGTVCATDRIYYVRHTGVVN